MAKNNVSLGDKLGISNEVLDVIKKQICDTIYPVGAIYISYNSTSPATLFGGTWTAINGRFLLAQNSTYTAQSVGGKEKHTHIFGVCYRPYYGVLIGADADALSMTTYDTNNNLTWGGSRNGGDGTSFRKNGALLTSADTSGGTGQIGRVGNTSYTSNLPPYLSVYMWRRTA